MIQHMNLVFGAEGLTVGEGAFLMACANHTDDRGYVIASMQQLADESHMKERTARDNKQRLIKRGLLAAAERYHPKNGARIADLYRVNVDLLKQSQRKPRDYGPTVIEELTFAMPGESRRSDPPAESAGGAAESAGGAAESAPTPPAESAPLLLPSSVPSSLSGVAASQGAAGLPAPREERDAATQHDKATAADVEGEHREQHDVAAAVVAAYCAAYHRAAGTVPDEQREFRVYKVAAGRLAGGAPVEQLVAQAIEQATADAADVVEAELVDHQEQREELDGAGVVAAAFAAAWMRAHGVELARAYVSTMRKQAAEHLAAGHPVEHLVGLVEQMAPKKWRNLTEHAAHNPPPAQGAGNGPAAPADSCPKHSAFKAGDCPPCIKAAREERAETAGPTPIDGAGLLARLRAGQPAA